MTANRNLAKIGMPRFSDHVPRHRLFKRLDELEPYRITWVCGPPGSGKTVLLASYLWRRQPQALWYRIDAEDTDPGTFVFYLGEALAARSRRAKTRLPRLTPEVLADLPGFMRRFFNDLILRLPAPRTLVLDNFQEGGAQVEELVSHACRAIPEKGRLFILSRVPPGEAFARYQANQVLALVDWEELKLTRDEAHSIASVGSPLPTADVDSAWERSRGWVAGLVLLLAHLRRYGVPSLSAPPDEGPVVVFDYFASVLFASFPKETKQLLSAAALLPQLTADQAAELSELDSAKRILDDLVRRFLFVDREDGPPRAYRLHPLFRQFLLSRTWAAVSAGERKAARLRAARLAERADDFEAAAALYREAEEWTELSRVVVEHAPMLLGQGRSRTLETLIDGIPEAFRTRDPWLSYWRGIAQLPSDPADARTFLEAAYRQFGADGLPGGCFLACAAILETYFFEWSTFAGEDPWIREMESLVRARADLLDTPIGAQVMSAGLALIYREPGHPILNDWGERVSRLLRSTPLGPQYAALGMFAVQLKLWRGRFRETANLLDELNMALQRQDASPISLIGFECWLAMHAWNAADFERAYAAVDRAITIGSDHGVHVLDALAYGQGVYAALSEQALDQARQFLSAMENALLPIRSLDRGFFFHLRFGYRLLSGDIAGARADIDTALAFADDAGAPFLFLLNVVGFAMLLLEDQQPERALAEIERALTFAQHYDARNIVFTALLLKAGALLAIADEPGALETAKSALTIGRENAYDNTTPFWYPKPVAQVCALALEHGIETEYARGLALKRRLAPPSIAIDAWPWPVKVFTLGRFSLALDNRTLPPSRKAQRRALDLLKALIALGGRGVGISNLTDLLWSDAEGPLARGAFDMAVYRLRKLLGREDAILVHDATVSLNPACCWVDVWCLERYLGELDALLRGPGPAPVTELVRCGERIFALFQGEFLERDPQRTWMLATRHRIGGRLRRALTGIGRHLEATGDWEQARRFYESALRRQPLVEEFYRRLIVCHRARGDLAEAVRAYNRCVETLVGALGAQVSAETTALIDETPP